MFSERINEKQRNAMQGRLKTHLCYGGKGKMKLCSETFVLKIIIVLKRIRD